MANSNSNARDLLDPQTGSRDGWNPYEHPQAGLKAAIRNLGREARVSPTAASTAETPAPPAVDTKEPAPAQRPSPQASHSSGGAVYSLELPTICPHCGSSIQTVRVNRLLRTQVSFTSTLPRKGYVIACPECERMLSADLSGMI